VLHAVAVAARRTARLQAQCPPLQGLVTDRYVVRQASLLVAAPVHSGREDFKAAKGKRKASVGASKLQCHSVARFRQQDIRSRPCGAKFFFQDKVGGDGAAVVTRKLLEMNLAKSTDFRVVLKRDSGGNAHSRSPSSDDSGSSGYVPDGLQPRREWSDCTEEEAENEREVVTVEMDGAEDGASDLRFLAADSQLFGF